MNPESLAHYYQEIPSLADLSLEIPAGCGGEELFTKPFLILHALSDLYTARTALGLAFDLGWEAPLRRGASVDELLEGFCPPSRIPAVWILKFLAEKGLLVQDGERYHLEGTPDLDLQELREMAEREAPGHLQNLDLLNKKFEQH